MLMESSPLIDLASLKQQLHYDPDTGIFRWKITRHRITSGKVAGFIRKGYVRIKIFGVQYSAHRLAWFYMTEKWPEDQIDHINMYRSDNRFCNLREANNGQNHMNTTHCNKTGFKGVRYHSWLKERPFEAQIKSAGKVRSLGCYPTAEEAHEAYKKAAIELHGEFARF